jgi:hypothetical protein
MTEKKEPTFETVHDVLHHIQKNLKAPKSNHNKFGGYNYRSCEDIVEAAKLIMPPGATLVILDDIRQVGERYYVQATAVLSYKGAVIEGSAYAREPENKKGSDESQITGAASSYARKYALNGLFMIDDTKDADATNQHGKTAEDQKTIDAVGGSVRDGVDTEQRDQMYNQALKDIAGCVNQDALKAVWTKIGKGKKVFTAEQWADIEQAKDEAKENLAPF